MLKVKLFGFAHATYADLPLPGFPNQQAWLLLCFLILNKNHPHNRERVAAVFWEDQPAHIARKNFRNTLWRLRQMLFVSGAQPDDYIHISDESISFINYAPYELDVDIIESASRCLSVPDQNLTPDHVSQLEMAVQQYTGDLLENVYEDWCLYDRERLRLTYFNILNKLMVYACAHGDYERGLTYGQRMLAYDHTREDIHRQIMWMYWHMGDRTAALMQYKVCTQVLEDELRVEPMETTRQLYEQIVHTAPQVMTWAKPAEPGPQALPQLKPEFQPLAQTALQQLQHLQKVLEQTNAELAQIERMINQALASSQQ